jgi:adenosylhomocysteine nucleosidase
VSITGIVAALTAEARTLGLRSPGGPGIETLPDGTLLCISGMGPEAARHAALGLLAAGARNLLSFGLAGALDPRLQAGTVLLAEAVVDGSGLVHPTFGPWREQLCVMAASRQVVGGALLSVMQPLATSAAKAQARARTGACAVDMESFAIGTVAVGNGLNFAVARVIVDTAGDVLPRCVQWATGPRGEVSLPRLAWGLVRAPGELGALLQLSRRYRAALDSLRYLGQRGLALP